MKFSSFVVTGAVLAASPLGAELNVPIATRVVSFLQPPISGQVQAAIIFAPGNAASLTDAAAIEHSIGAGLSTGGAVIRTRRVPVASLGALSGARIAFVTAGLRNEQPEIARAAARSQTITITADQTCVQAAHCVIGIGAGSRVQISVSRAAARAVNAKFGSAFLMLVKEI